MAGLTSKHAGFRKSPVLMAGLGWTVLTVVLFFSYGAASIYFEAVSPVLPDAEHTVEVRFGLRRSKALFLSAQAASAYDTLKTLAFGSTIIMVSGQVIFAAGRSLRKKRLKRPTDG